MRQSVGRATSAQDKDARPTRAMHIAFLNPQGNFDPQDRYWGQHPDFGGQLVYVKELALALGRLGHQVDILTRRVRDPAWPGFETDFDAYPGHPNVRILRFPCGGDRFMRKEDLWPYLGTEWLPNLIAFYRREGRSPQVVCAHYADGGLAAALWQARGGPLFTFTAHSLGAQKLDRLLATGTGRLSELDTRYRFGRRLAAEQVAMSRAAQIITSTDQERHEQYSHPAYRHAVDPGDDRRFAVVPPGVNADIFHPAGRGPQAQQVADRVEQSLQRHIAPCRRHLPAVITGGRLDPKKNLAGLFRAFAEHPTLRARANLIVLTRGLNDLRNHDGLSDTERAVLQEVVALCNAGDLWGKVAVLPLQGQAELAAAYRHLRRRRSVFCLPALYEPFGLAPLEAMACGLPVVVTHRGGPSETLREGNLEFGVLADPTDPQDLARGLLRLLGSEEEWHCLARLGRQRVLTRYTWDHTARGYLEVLQDLHPPKGHTLSIPPYFLDPRPEHELRVEAWAPNVAGV